MGVSERAQTDTIVQPLQLRWLFGVFSEPYAYVELIRRPPPRPMVGVVRGQCYARFFLEYPPTSTLVR